MSIHFDQRRVLAAVAVFSASGAMISLLTTPRVGVDAPPITTLTSAPSARMYFEQTASSPGTFVARGVDYALSLGATGATLAVQGASARAKLDLSFVGANPFTVLQPAGSSAPVAHYYVGNDVAAWRRNVSLHEQVVYRNLYSGIDAVFYGSGRSFEYDFIVAPHADPGQITLRFPRHGGMHIDSSGDLILATRAGTVRQRRPVAYQTINDERKNVASSYAITADGDVRIDVGEYDAGLPLIIDPVLDFSTYFGGSAIDVATRVAVDGGGNVYVVGYTFSPDIKPANSFGDNATVGDQINANVFVSKYAANGALDYVAVIGGSNVEYGRDIVVNANGVVYVTGETQSSNFPVTGTSPRPFGGADDAFVTVLSADGSTLVYSGLLGGDGSDYGHGLALGANGNVYVAGETWSVNFPVTASTAYSTTCNGCGTDTYDGFLTVLDIAKDPLVYSTYYGGSDNDKIHTVAVHPSSGVAYIAGETFSPDLPVVNAAQSKNAGKSDIVVAALDPGVAGTDGLIYASYLGGGDDDTAEKIALNGDGHVYVAGVTSSEDFPSKNAYQTTRRGERDALVAKFNPAASSVSSLLFSTYFGGGGDESADAIALNASGAPVIAGMTSSADLPTVLPIQRERGGETDGFIATLSVGGNSLQYATYVGGSEDDGLTGVAVAPNGFLIAAGDSNSTDVKMVGAPQRTFAGVTDAIVVKVDSSAGSTPSSGSSGGASTKPGGGPFDAFWLLAFAFAAFRRYRAGA